ncbi:DDE-domain-containing protein, partial [Trametes versicolor FP-101664 SS1]|uniref:DDE-domain-containing protein n=1 Tax=Trametes versicolor (strain FP-101664) TaxID=717944 RepID=UPI000462125F
PIVPECIYGMDETGLQQGVGGTERVIGPSGRKFQYQQESGDRENITVLVTICADGSSIPPAVIYKGEAYQAAWKQDNPLNASLGYSKKGYVNGEISAEWIKQFDKHTKEKAAGRRRLLLVDGHNSHYTFEFLDYARKNRIHVLCYPSHSTHVYQGLDVVIFSVLKQHWKRARDTLERRGEKVTKATFLSVYGGVHVAALTPANIKAAFRKTGVEPFNPDVITADLMAPSLETSSQGHLPFMQTSPVR